MYDRCRDNAADGEEDESSEEDYFREGTIV